jgi:hypothetical protein
MPPVEGGDELRGGGPVPPALDDVDEHQDEGVTV